MQSVKVQISKTDKVEIGLPSMPTPEINLVALSNNDNELLLIEAKSFLDSYGVYFQAVSDDKDKGSKRYKLLTNDIFRERVTTQLRTQFTNKGLINTSTIINYALADPVFCQQMGANPGKNP